MSIVKITITEDHLKLVKYLTFNVVDGHLTTFEEGKESAFGFEELYSEIGLILYGKPVDFDPMSVDPIIYTEEQISAMEKLWLDLPTVLELKCFYDKLVPGTYQRKFHNRDWRESLR